MRGSTRFDISEARRRLAGNRGKRLWSSLEEIVDEVGFREWLEAEFPSAATVLARGGRREFLKLMGASLLLAGVASCAESPSDIAVPYVEEPEELVPGIPRLYATAVPLAGYAQPVIATTHAGRPTKLDGNPSHPLASSASDIFTQASVLQLYDPDRSKTPMREGVPSTWAAFQRALAGMRANWTARRGKGLRILSGDVTSPTLIRQMQQLLSDLPEARWHLFEPIGAGERREAMRIAFGKVVDIHVHFEHCEVVVTLDDDFIGPGPYQVACARAWSQRRGEKMPGQGRVRVHAAESTPGLAGAVASTRLAVNASRMGELALALAVELAGLDASVPALDEPERRWMERAVRELRSHGGRSAITIGAHLVPDIQALAPLINERLGNAGATVWYSEPVAFIPGTGSSLSDLAADIRAGAVETLITIDSNPAYAAPGELEFSMLLPSIRESIHFGLYADETAALSRWHLPLAHALESWSDGRAVDGSATIMQPLLAPLYGGQTIHQVLDMLLGTIDRDAAAPVRATWTQAFGDDFEGSWRRALHDGFVASTAFQPITVTASATAPASRAPADGSRVDVLFRPDSSVWDGRFANLGWLQEMPKPLSTVTWDNVVSISPVLAQHARLANGDLVEVTVKDRRVTGPAWIMPGQAPDTVTLYLGYGRRRAGGIGDGVGYDAYGVRPSNSPWVASGTLRRLGGKHQLATTQLHHRMEGFDFVREVTARDPNVPERAAQMAPPSLYPQWPSTDYAWGMVIDLDLCIGCNMCVTACVAENNIAVVGKEQVAAGREMHWLRVDRYYSGEADNPRSFFQPIPCMHCEKAPCEIGCPVHATVHGPEGLNEMVYNRCIGTRTCSSYCPYKVRRFNWFDYRQPQESPTHAAHNPDVTVRSRGVMEKCTYCTQRIQAAHAAADKEQRKIGTDAVVTACQQACPTSAIVFGNLKDAESAVAARRRSGRHYVLLGEFGTRPRTTYLARWRDDADEAG
ncbi:MAG: molybdopterin oxidoreductase [Blastocatellia bacterium]|nr:MAG: molybdopterin oxidoreductase [Blastocatellia bacterium]